MLGLVVIFLPICLVGSDCSDDECYAGYENLILRENMVSFLINKKTYKGIKEDFSSVSLGISEKLPEENNRIAYSFGSVNTIPRSHISEWYETTIKELQEEFGMTSIPEKLQKRVESQKRRISYAKKVTDYYDIIDLSEGYGASHHLGYGIFGFIQDPKNKDDVIIGMVACDEKWTEAEHVRLVLDKWKHSALLSYLKYKTFLILAPDISKDLIQEISQGDDINKIDNMYSCQSTKTNIIVIGDKSYSMSDDANFIPQQQYIKDSGYLNNRLGALYSGIQDFIDIRLKYECDDVISTVLFDSYATTIEANINIYDEYVKDYLIKHAPSGGTDFGNAFKEANDLINFNENGIVIFLTDGEASDNGVSDIVSNWSKNMKDKLKFYCVVVGHESSAVVNEICESASGEVKKVLNGEEMVGAFKEFGFKETRKN